MLSRVDVVLQDSLTKTLEPAYVMRELISLTLWRRNYFFNFSTPCT